MKYKDAIKQSMKMLAQDERTVFLGYNIKYGSRGYGTFSGVPESKCIETPVAENLMTGLAIGMSMAGYKPLLFFERHDFMLNAFDSLINHLNIAERVSDGEFKTPVIIRATVGGTKPIYPGMQHIKDFSRFFKETFDFPVYELNSSEEILSKYREALGSDRPTMFIERRDLYDIEI